MGKIESTPSRLAESLMGLQVLLNAPCYVMPMLYWFGVVHFGPLECLMRLGVVPTNPDRLLGVWYWLLGGAWWAPLTYMLLLPFRKRIIVKLMGSEAAYRTALEEIEEIERASQAATELGELIGVAVHHVGFFNRAESIVETSEGFFRVIGCVSNVRKGAAVSMLNNELVVASEAGVTKRYALIKD
ncbi:hypothetical protein ALO95_200041 [Pseudomonas syringae pv. antirrhini]|nr:hypothetical protein [Pseudomonas syringae group genomosp. 3]RMP38517.1 hypothetical protein ALQ24_200074 [Pseudomonas syringae pv. antirrhini]RMP41742.1 hypothetical protein ALQ23_200113 [Pseudomonas syringae pv. antirrhini]RMW24170.1 hypothetical protein ALO95_200041 [Pseudomonas syringae pv. antirrhini]WIN10124.1 hypothetical protein QQF68_28165 [Pseudomonas syringae pv. antirrhini str. 126]